MNAWIWTDSADRAHKLLTKGETIPHVAADLAKGEWVRDEEVTNLLADDHGLALDSAAAVSALDSRGFYEIIR